MSDVFAFLPHSQILQNTLSGLNKDDHIFHVCASFDEIREKLQTSEQNSFSLILFDQELLNTLDLQPNQISRSFAIANNQKWLPENPGFESLQKFRGYWGQRTDGRDLHIFENILNAARTGTTPVFETFFQSQGLKTDSQNVWDTKSKSNVLCAIEQFVQSLASDTDSERFNDFASKISEAVDELILNAIWDANPRFRGADRSQEFNLASLEQIIVRWGFDGDLFGFSVRDPFGELLRVDVVSHLSSAINQLGPFATRKSGGLGLRRVVERSHHVALCVQKDSATEIQGFLRFERRFRDFSTIPKSLHFFTDQTN